MDLEKEIHAINAKLNDMCNDISLIKQRDEFDAKEKADLTNVVKSLEVSINRLNLTIGKNDGVKEGRNHILNFVGVAVGSILLMWIAWITSTTASNKEDISIFKKIIEQKEAKV